jgi:hypothetical protein
MQALYFNPVSCGIQYSTWNMTRGIQHAENGACNKGRAYGTCSTACGIQHVEYGTWKTTRRILHVEYSTWIRQLEYGSFNPTCGIHWIKTLMLCALREMPYKKKSIVCNITHAVREGIMLWKAHVHEHVAVSKYKPAAVINLINTSW